MPPFPPACFHSSSRRHLTQLMRKLLPGRRDSAERVGWAKARFSIYPRGQNLTRAVPTRIAGVNDFAHPTHHSSRTLIQHRLVGLILIGEIHRVVAAHGEGDVAEHLAAGAFAVHMHRECVTLALLL